jgi:hypothetical protein
MKSFVRNSFRRGRQGILGCAPYRLNAKKFNGKLSSTIRCWHAMTNLRAITLNAAFGCQYLNAVVVLMNDKFGQMSKTACVLSSLLASENIDSQSSRQVFHFNGGRVALMLLASPGPAAAGKRTISTACTTLNFRHLNLHWARLRGAQSAFCVRATAVEDSSYNVLLVASCSAER